VIFVATFFLLPRPVVESGAEVEPPVKAVIPAVTEVAAVIETPVEAPAPLPVLGVNLILDDAPVQPLNAVRLREIDGVNYLFLPYWSREGFCFDGADFVVMFGSQIPTIFIVTESGCMEFIHADMNNRERVEFLFVDEHGRVEYSGSGDMNGRGNHTWQQPKRPYNFRLEYGVRVPLFGLGEGRHWTLLANYMDLHRVRNIVSLNLARELGISHTSRIRPVDVFINGDYAGVFDLVERRSIDHAVNLTNLEESTAILNGGDLSVFEPAGVHEPLPGTMKYFDIPFDPPDISGGYLLEVQFPRRYMLEYSGFVTTRGMAVNLRAPGIATRNQVAYISEFFRQMEDAVYSETGYNAAGRHFSEFLDIRSFAMLYILEEFLLNVDAGNSSFFMYKDSVRVGSGRIYAGPPWDYDLSLGTLGEAHGVNFRDPHLWWVNSGHMDFNPQTYLHLYAALWRHEIFRETVRELWQTEAAPIIRILVGLEDANSALRPIDSYIEDIYASRQMDMLIWPMREYRRFYGQTPYLTEFARERFLFLDSHWG
jgi:hypothetical protein